MTVNQAILEEMEKEWEKGTALLGEVVNAKLTNGEPMVVVRVVEDPETESISVLRYINVGAVRGENWWEVSVDVQDAHPRVAVKALIKTLNIGRR